MTKKILLIDDSKTQLLSLKMIISKAGYEVITAPNAIEGIELAYHNMPDLIISDIVMPSINGYQLCRLLKNDPATKHIPIILLTILEGKIDKFWGLKAGADKFFNKESEPEELIKEIESILATIEDKPHKTPVKNVTFTENAYHVKINEILDQSLIESTIINEFRNLSEFIHDESALLGEISTIVESILDFDTAAIFFNSADNKKLKQITFLSNLDETLLKDMASEFLSTVFEGTEPNEFTCENIKLKDAQTPPPYKTKLIIPITLDSETIGAIGLYSHKEINYQNQKTFEIILNEMKLLMQIKHLHSKTKLLTVIDPLTTLYNRRYYQEVIEREFSRSRRYNFDLSVAMFDIDNFKKLNDTYGHQFGDEVLKAVSQIIIASLRNTDFAFRYGGEEILAILTNSSSNQAFIPIERIRAKIEEYPFCCNGQNIKVTISAGISEIKQEISTAQNLAKVADEALYEAKHSGKNKVIIAKQ